MIGIKSFHLFFISMSILLSGWYGYFEITSPSNPGSVSTYLSIITFMVMFGLGFYGYSFFKKFREI